MSKFQPTTSSMCSTEQQVQHTYNTQQGNRRYYTPTRCALPSPPSQPIGRTYCSEHGSNINYSYVPLKTAPSPWGDWVLHLTHGTYGLPKSTCQMAPRSVQPFLYGSKMLCCTMHCQWGRKPPKLPLPLGISSPCRRRTEPQPQATCTEKLVKIAHVVSEITLQIDRHTDRQDRRAHHNTSTTAPAGDVIMHTSNEHMWVT